MLQTRSGGLPRGAAQRMQPQMEGVAPIMDRRLVELLERQLVHVPVSVTRLVKLFGV